MPAVKNKSGVYFSKGFLSAIDSTGAEIVFGSLQEFGFKSNFGLREFMDSDSLLASAVGISEEKITLTAKHGKFKPDKLVLALGGSVSTVSAVADATTAPTLTAGAGATPLTLGFVGVAYAYRTPYGSTKISTIATVSITATQKITVTALTLPAGVTSADLFVTAASYLTAPLAAAAPLYKLASMSTGVAYDIVGYPLTSANTPKTASEVGVARDLYTKGLTDEPTACTLQFNTEADGSGLEIVAYGVIFPDIDWTAALRDFIIPNLTANVYGDATTGKAFVMLMPAT